ncbi:TIGR03086 family metal-binding protein [Nocardiopsis rhodophaea]|uniref:TIGR03086 family metal-binding protein n=1 Tax=Nocardiopsis rhodophaea TaxID=280238 RepID=A0ABP5EXR7_9ACTN
MVSENTVYSALDWAAGKVRGIGDVPLSAPTPCAEWDLGQVLNHMINTLDLVARGLAGEQVDPASLDPQATAATPISGTPEAAFAAAAARARVVFADPGIWDRRFTGAFSADSARDIAGVAVGDVTGHGWDIARDRAGRDHPRAARGRGLRVCPRISPARSAGCAVRAGSPAWARCDENPATHGIPRAAALA